MLGTRNLISVSYSNVKSVIKDILLGGHTPFIYGPPGIGKSYIAFEVGMELGYKNITELCAFLLMPTDYTLPVPDHSSKTVQLYKTGFLPERDALVVIDDLPHATKTQMLPLFQLIQFKRLGNLKLENVSFIITGNREEDLAAVNQIPSPLKNRVCQMVLEVDTDEWLEWAQKNGIHEYVIGFLSFYKDELLKLPKHGVHAWPTPRSWHMLSDILKTCSKPGDFEHIKILASTCVGLETGTLFGIWYEHLQFADPEKILKDGISKNIPKEKQYAEVLSVVKYIKTQSFEKVKKLTGTIDKFVNSLPGEYKSIFLRLLAKDMNITHVYELFKNMKSVSEHYEYLFKS